MAQSDLDNSLKKQLEQIRDERLEHANTATRIGGAFLALFSYLGSFLRKDGNDVVNGLITFVKGILIGKGFGFAEDGVITSSSINNSDFIKTRNLTVTGKLTVFELEIERAKSVGGLLIVSPADFRVDAVENIASGWRCYMLAEDETSGGTSRKLRQMWQAGDQAFCQTESLDGSTGEVRYYWRAVTGVSTANVVLDDDKEYLYIDLSASDCDASSTETPAVGDNLVLLGNHELIDRDGNTIAAAEEARQGAEVLSAYRSVDPFLADKAPYKAQYWGINDYNLTGHLKTYFARGKNHIVGDIEMTAGSTVDGKPLGETLKGLEKNIEAAKAQSDQQIVLWFGDETPTLENEPYTLWTNDAERSEHVGDIYYNRSKTDETSGHAYGFKQDDSGVYYWEEITDSDVLYALELAAQARQDATTARNEAEAAVRAIDAMADDNILTAPEKQRLGRELTNLWYERYGTENTAGLDVDGRSTGVSTEKYDSAFDSLTSYLNGGDAWSGHKNVDGLLELPSLLSAPGDTEINGQEFSDRWANLYVCRTELINDIANTHIRCFVGLPQPPYKSGDIWVNATWPIIHTKDEELFYDNDTLVCIFGRAEGEKFDINDWQPQQRYTTNIITKQIQMQDRIASIICGEQSVDDIQNLIANAADWQGLFSGLIGLKEDYNVRMTTIDSTISTLKKSVTGVQDEIKGYVQSNFVQYVKDGEGGLKLFASYLDEDGNTIKTASLALMASADSSKLKLTADDLILEGLVTANDNFKILQDGSIVSKNASITGKFYSEDHLRGNKIIISAEDGYIKMIGPVGVDDEYQHLPSSDERTDLFELKFETDGDTLSRYARMSIDSYTLSININPMQRSIAFYDKRQDYNILEIKPDRLTMLSDKGRIDLSDDGLSFRIGGAVKTYKGLEYNFNTGQYE